MVLNHGERNIKAGTGNTSEGDVCKWRLRWGCTAQIQVVEGVAVAVWVVGMEAEHLPQLVAAEAGVLLLLQRAHRHHPPRR